MVSGASEGNDWILSCSAKIENFRNHLKFVKESRAWDKGQQPCSEELVCEHRSTK